jgi:MYXO-CTERM domain-containing protein
MRALFVWALVSAVALPARATWSVVATDAETREVGGAGTTCLGDVSLRIIYGSAPGHGVIHAQAQLATEARDRAIPMLAADVDPAEILRVITDPTFDPQAQTRQYGIVDIMGRAVGFTGDLAFDYAEARPGTIGAITYSVQGNILTSVAVIDQSEAAMRAGGCDLADRLMRSLEAGAEGGEGDWRCTRHGYASDTAFLQVDRDGEPAGSYVVLEVRDTAPESAVVALRREYDGWRASSPCPAAPIDAAVPVDAGRELDDAGIRDDASPLDASEARGTDGARVSDAGAPMSRAGCGCSSAGDRAPAGAALGIAWLAVIRAGARRRRRHTASR